MLTSAFSDDYRQLNLSPSAKKRRNLCTGQFLACVAASPRTHQSHLYSPLYTEGLERLRSRQGRSGPHLCIRIWVRTMMGGGVRERASVHRLKIQYHVAKFKMRSYPLRYKSRSQKKRIFTNTYVVSSWLLGFYRCLDCPTCFSFFNSCQRRVNSETESVFKVVPAKIIL